MTVLATVLVKEVTLIFVQLEKEFEGGVILLADMFCPVAKLAIEKLKWFEFVGGVILLFGMFCLVAKLAKELDMVLLGKAVTGASEGKMVFLGAMDKDRLKLGDNDDDGT